MRLVSVSKSEKNLHINFHCNAHITHLHMYNVKSIKVLKKMCGFFPLTFNMLPSKVTYRLGKQPNTDIWFSRNRLGIDNFSWSKINRDLVSVLIPKQKGLQRFTVWTSLLTLTVFGRAISAHPGKLMAWDWADFDAVCGAAHVGLFL